MPNELQPEPAVQSMPKKAEKFQLHAVNDPNRVDYQILGALLKRELTVPPEEEVACKALKDALLEAFIRDPQAVILCACFAEVGKRPKVLNTLWSADPSDVEMREDSLSFLATRLWSRNASGREGVAMQEGGLASANAILYWDPRKGGVLPYIEHRVQLLTYDFIRERLTQRANTSLDYLREAGLEVADEGNFVRMRNDDHDYSGHKPGKFSRAAQGALDDEYVDGAGIGEDVRDPEDAARAIEEERAGDSPDDEEDEHEFDSDEARANSRGKRKKRYRRPTHEELRSPARPDALWLQDVLHERLEFDPVPQILFEQLRTAGLRVVVELCQDRPDFEDMHTLAVDWNPSVYTFSEWLPEAVEHITPDDISPERAARIQRDAAAKAPTGPIQLDFLNAIELGILPTRDQSVAQTMLAKGGETAKQYAHLLRLEAVAWRARSTDGDDLDSPTRPDYQWLCARLREKPYEDVERKELHAEVKRLAINAHVLSYSQETKKYHAELMEHLKDKWRPGTEYFNETVADWIAVVRERDQAILENGGSPKPAALSPSPTVSPEAMRAAAEGLETVQPQVAPLQPDFFG
jgi:hypothetical protein